MVGQWRVAGKRPLGACIAALTGLVLAIAATHANGSPVAAFATSDGRPAAAGAVLGDTVTSWPSPLALGPTAPTAPATTAPQLDGRVPVLGRAAAGGHAGGPAEGATPTTTTSVPLPTSITATTAAASTSTTAPAPLTPPTTVVATPFVPPPAPIATVAPSPVPPAPPAPSLPDPAGGGYQLQLPALFFRMVVRPSSNFTGPGLTAARDAVAELNSIVPAGWTVGPPLDGDPAYNEVKISYGDAAAACPGEHGGAVSGCTGAIGQLLKTRQIYIVIDPSATASPKLLRHHVFHELGHAIGLDHFDGLIDGQPQMMASSANEATAAVHFGPGDRNGMAALVQNELTRLLGARARLGA